MNALKRIAEKRNKKRMEANHLFLKAKLDKEINNLSDKLDSQAVKIIKDLIQLLYPLKTNDVDVHGAVDDPKVYLGEDCGVIVSTVAQAELEYIETDAAKLINTQFASFSEGRRYCEGTDKLLGILTQYHYIETEKAKFIATPDAYITVGNRAVFRDEDVDHYNSISERGVLISVIAGDLFIMFGFSETVDKKNDLVKTYVHQGTTSNLDK